MSINEFIDMAIYINLEERVDKKELIEQMLIEYDVAFERLNAFKTSPTFIGCAQSHLEALKLARERKFKNVLILEDDFEFCVSKEQAYEIIKKFFDRYGNDFDVLMLAYTKKTINGMPDDPDFSEMSKTHGAAGYIVNERLYDKLINQFEWALPLLQSTHQHWNYANDVSWHKLQFPENKWYGSVVRIGKQRKILNDHGTITDHDGC